MKFSKIIAILLLALTLLTLVGGTYAQVAGDPDPDGDGLPNSVDRCDTQPGPRENGGCPLATPEGRPADDRDGDGVADFVDQCPDQAGTGFTQGCPVEAAPTNIPVVLVIPDWWTLQLCLVNNPNSQGVNVRSFVPDPNNPMQPVILGVLEPGDQFAPLYAKLDVNNTMWYGGYNIAATQPANMLGWVSGAVTDQNGNCDQLGEPPTNAPARADTILCMLIVPDGDGAPLFNQPDGQQIGVLNPGSLFPMEARQGDWYRGANGWVMASDVETQGNCDFRPLPIRYFPNDPQIVIDPVITYGGSIPCVVTVPEGPGVKIYYAPYHDEAIVITIVPPGYTSPADGAVLGSNGNTWYAMGAAWVDGAEVLLSGACENIPAPIVGEDVNQCWALVPSEGAAIDLFDNPDAGANVIGSAPPGSHVLIDAQATDAAATLWYHTTAAGGGWIQAAGVIPFNAGACSQVQETVPPANEGDCQVTVVGDGAGLWASPSKDGSGLYGGQNAGATYTVEGIYVDEDGVLWYNVGGAWISSQDVAATGDCADLPPYYPNGVGCTIYAPWDNGNGQPVDVYDSYNNGSVIGQIPAIQNAKANFAGTDEDGLRWYYITYEYDGLSGWVRSTDVIEGIPAVCDDLPPMLIINLDIILIPFEPIVFPFPDPGPVIGG